MKLLNLFFFTLFALEANELTDIQIRVAEEESYAAQLYPITSGAEKSFVWKDSMNPIQTEYSLLYLHGFSATRKEVEPLPQLLAKHFKANLYLNRLSSHGQDLDLFKEVEYQDWLKDVEEDLKIASKIGKKIIILATSTGATLATHLAYHYPQQIHGLIFLSPLYGAKDSKSELLTKPIIGPLFQKIFLGEFRKWEPENVLHGLYWKHYYYSRAVTELVGLVQEVRELDLEEIKTPSCWYYTEKDDVISLKRMHKAYKKFGSTFKNISEFKEAKGHVLAGDILNASGTLPLLNEIIKCSSSFSKVP